jgi:phosphoribosylaminoimidazolecarboxamide formyltransferase / IMP cyclohydrolase
MTIRDLKGFVEDTIPLDTVLVSVSEKKGLESFIPGLIQVEPKVLILSTGGTYDRIKDILGPSYTANLMEVAEYTQLPEMEGGLVKTLHPMIHAGILGERNNPQHLNYLVDTFGPGALFIDLVVVNLYPFEEMVGKIERGEIDKKTQKPFSFESGRGNIYIGGPTLLRGAAKNFLGCAVICDPTDYVPFLQEVRANGGATSFAQRRELARKAFATTARYDAAIAAYLSRPETQAHAIRSLYQFNNTR